MKQIKNPVNANGDKNLFQIKQGVLRTTSVYFVGTVIFEISCKSVSRKSLSVIKIENCHGGICLIQRS